MEDMALMSGGARAIYVAIPHSLNAVRVRVASRGGQSRRKGVLIQVAVCQRPVTGSLDSSSVPWSKAATEPAGTSAPPLSTLAGSQNAH